MTTVFSLGSSLNEFNKHPEARRKRKEPKLRGIALWYFLISVNSACFVSWSGILCEIRNEILLYLTTLLVFTQENLHSLLPNQSFSRIATFVGTSAVYTFCLELAVRGAKGGVLTHRSFVIRTFRKHLQRFFSRMQENVFQNIFWVGVGRQSWRCNFFCISIFCGAHRLLVSEKLFTLRLIILVF